MATKVTRKLQETHTKAIAGGHWALAAASAGALADESSLDHQINVVGALHEVGQLRNRLAPFWQSWRVDEAAWAGRCVERLAGSDHDYWAVAALLGADVRRIWPVFTKAGYKALSVRSCPEFDRANTHIAVLSSRAEGRVWSPVFEMGWDAKSGEVTEASRWRAILVQEVSKVGENHIGKGTGSYFMRAALPHGSWRVVSAEFELVREAVIPIEKTLLKNVA